MEIKSVFSNNSRIPSEFTCEGGDFNPKIEFLDVPTSALSLILIVDDPDAPNGNWVHWLVYNISPKIKKINENSVPNGAKLGLNSMRKQNYHGPCPPSGTHRYFFKLYAIDNVLEFSNLPNKSEILSAIEGHIIEKAELVGIYSRKKVF